MIKSYLHTFITVCEKGSFTKAASALFITPSAVIQQVNALESDLSVTLLVRSPKGVNLTPAGEYLYAQGKELLRRNAQIRKELRAVSAAGSEICVGTSLLEKCRLLYDLWVLFSEKEKDYSIRMLPIGAGHAIPAEVELVESVNSHLAWSEGWEFMEICQVPFGFAFSKDHPLASKKSLLPEDLAGQRVVSFNTGTSDRIAAMLFALKKAGADLLFWDAADSSVLEECAHRRYVLVSPLCWDDILVDMVMRPCRWGHSVPYGIFFRPDPSPSAGAFLDFIRGNYEGQDPRATVWTL